MCPLTFPCRDRFRLVIVRLFADVGDKNGGAVAQRTTREVEDHLHRAVAGDIGTDLGRNDAGGPVVPTGFGVFRGHEERREANRRCAEIRHQTAARSDAFGAGSSGGDAGSHGRRNAMTEQSIAVQLVTAPGCAKCERAKQAIRDALGHVQNAYRIEVHELDLTAQPAIAAEHGIWSTPALVIDGELAFVGRVNERELRQKLAAAAERA